MVSKLSLSLKLYLQLIHLTLLIFFTFHLLHSTRNETSFRIVFTSLLIFSIHAVFLWTFVFTSLFLILIPHSDVMVYVVAYGGSFTSVILHAVLSFIVHKIRSGALFPFSIMHLFFLLFAILGRDSLSSMLVSFTMWNLFIISSFISAVSSLVSFSGSHWSR